jgi:hypothetical protein
MVFDRNEKKQVVALLGRKMVEEVRLSGEVRTGWSARPWSLCTAKNYELWD